MAKLSITCKEATDFISRREEGKLSVKQLLQLWLHFGICSLCKLFARQNKVFIKNAKHLDENSGESLSPSQKQSIIEVLDKG